MSNSRWPSKAILKIRLRIIFSLAPLFSFGDIVNRKCKMAVQSHLENSFAYYLFFGSVIFLWGYCEAEMICLKSRQVDMAAVFAVLLSTNLFFSHICFTTASTHWIVTEDGKVQAQVFI